MPNTNSTSNPPWYRNGLRFRCTGCGDCCTGAPGYVWVNQAEIAAMAGALGLDVAAFEDRFVRLVGIRKSLIEHRNGDCVFFDNKSRHCKIYQHRPRQCRTFPFWPSNLRSAESWAEMASRCHGANQGPLVRLEKIIEIAGIVHV